jgi:hypothetical protein
MILCSLVEDDASSPPPIDTRLFLLLVQIVAIFSTTIVHSRALQERILLFAP